jgi:hypothetical protein
MAVFSSPPPQGHGSPIEDHCRPRVDPEANGQESLLHTHEEVGHTSGFKEDIQAACCGLPKLSGHGLIETHLKKVKKTESDECWWTVVRVREKADEGALLRKLREMEKGVPDDEEEGGEDPGEERGRDGQLKVLSRTTL